jgi:hypothetical protein
MEQVSFDTNEAPEITITYVGGDLRLTGWERNQFQAEAVDRNELQAEASGAGVTLACRSGCGIWVPHKARIKVKEVKGDIRAKALDGALDIQAVQGCLIVRQAGAVSAERVSGDVNAKRLDGALKLGTVMGTVLVQGVAGDFEAGAVGGDLHVIRAAGSIKSRSAGDSDFRVGFTPGHDYALDAGGDMRLRALRSSVARLEIQAGGEISALVVGAQVEGDTRNKVVTLGRGEAGGPAPANVKVHAGGDVSLSGAAAGGDLDELGEDIGRLADEYAAQIEDRIQSHLADFEHLTENFAYMNMPSGATDARADQMAAHFREAMEQIGEKARRKAEAAQRKIEREAARGYRRHMWGWKADTSSRPGGANPSPAEPVSDSERLAVLRMLEQGKISVADAEKLLAALEGHA